jgi:glycosyltransferase involved in cell wall biosynthesis
MVCLVKIDEPPNRRSASIGVDVEDSNVSVVPEPLVSVLLPTHNRPVWLAEAIRSVLAGDFIDFEVVVSNNGRPEHTRELAEVIRDDRIRWLEQDPDTGILRNFLAALERARGRYIAVLHDDDRWAPNMLSALVPPLQRRADAVLSFADHFRTDRDGRVDLADTNRNSRRWGRTALAQGYHQPFFQLAARQSVPITVSVFRRDALAPSALPESVATCYDIWLCYGLACTGGAAYYHDERLLFSRRHPGQHSASRELAGPSSAIALRARMLEDQRMRAYAGVLRERLARDHLTAGAALLRSGARQRAREHLVNSTRMHPSWKATAGLAASWLAPTAVLNRI